MDQVKLYWKNATADAVGAEHGVSAQELDDIAPRIAELHEQFNVERKAGNKRYRDLPYDDEMLKAVGREVKHFGRKCEILVVLGIGGSALGNIALHNALNSYTHNLSPKHKRPQLFVLDNVDPDQIRSVVEYITPRIRNTVINIISKSGETAETAAQFILFRDLLKKKLGKKYAASILATTDAKGGTLREICKDEGYRTLEVPDGVGGRFSVLSAVGLFSAAMTGIKIDKLLAGAAHMDTLLQSPDVRKNPAALIAAIHYILDRRGKNMAVMMPYSSSLYYLGDWFRQLWAESLGKKDGLNKTDVFAGQTPIKALGTTDQHSQVQLYREGPNDKVITFLEVQNFSRKLSIPKSMKHVETLKYLAGSDFQTLMNAEKLGTEYALLESQRPTLSVIFPKISPTTVGQFIYLYECAVSYMGGLYDINTYDQPAVQLGKDATYALMGKPGFDDLKTKINAAVAKRDETFLI